MKTRKTFWAAALPLMATLIAGSAVGAPLEDVAAVLSHHELQSLEGDRFTIGDLKGEVLMVNFWATWCKPCLKELPIMDQWNSEFAKKGGRVIAISVDYDSARAGRFVKFSNLSLPVCHDGPHGLARLLDLPSLPCTYVLDRRGEVEYVAMKTSDEELQNLQRVMSHLLASEGDGE